MTNKEHERLQHVGAGDSKTGKHTIIATAELERLQALERKVEAFLEALHFDSKRSIDTGQSFVSWHESHCRWEIDRYVDNGGGNFVPVVAGLGPALHKAFELFEAPKEGV